MSNHWGSYGLNMDVRLSSNLDINIWLSSDFLMHIRFSGNVFMDIRLSSNFLMDIRLSINLDINVWFSSNFLMDIRFSSRVKVSISIRASSIGSSSYRGCSSISIGSRVGIASWGNDTSLCGGQTGKDSNKGSHFSYAMLLLF